MRAAFLTIAVIGAISSSANADAFSADEVLTVCLTTRPDPTAVPNRFIAEGWEPISVRKGGPEWNTLTLIQFATWSGLESILTEKTPQENWVELWASAEQFVLSMTEAPTDKRLTFLKDPESGSILVVKTGIAPTLKIQCDLAVPAPVAKQQTFFPKLRSPDLHSAFRAEIQVTELPTRATEIYSITVSVDPMVVSKKMGIETDIAAIYSVTIRYPYWAVSP